MIPFRILVSFLFFFLGISGFTQGLEFTENKGQWDSRVKLKTDMSNGALFLEAQGYTVVQHNNQDLSRVTSRLHGHTPEQEPSHIIPLNGTSSYGFSKPVVGTDSSVMRSHAYRVLFANSNPNPQILPEKPQSGISNYFSGNDPSKWGTGCKLYGAVVYKNIYPGVDVRYYGDNGQLKFDILVQPNADLSKLALEYQGVDGLEIKNGDLYIKTSVATTRELYPYSYQIVEGQRKQVSCRYKIYNHTVRFDLDGYDKTMPLVIDPSVIFTTFTGSRANNWGYTATYGPGGVGYAGGIVFGSGYPVNAGAFQTNYGGGINTGEDGGYDIGIIKLNANGTQRLYATYVGGGGNEAPHSMIADAQGNLVVAGRTTSSNFPGTVIGRGGGWDIVVFKLSATGNAMIGSIRIGGAQDDGVNIKNKYPTTTRESLQQYYGDDSRSEVIVDGAGNILLASCTQSDTFPVTIATAAQPRKTGGQDALFLKFNPNLTALTYGTYFGGSKNDAAYVLEVSPETGNVYVGGGTESDNIPGNKTGVISSTLNGPVASGDIDGFVAVYTPAGSLIRSTYIGTGGIDQVYGLKFDRYGFPYIMGTSLGNFPVINAAFSQAGGKQFIAKLQKDLSAYVYSTVFGTNNPFPNISPIAFLVDRCQNVYVSGWGGQLGSNNAFLVAGTIGMSTTAGAIKTNTDGNDFYFFVLQRDATAQLYGSFFGQNGRLTDHVDGGTSRFDENGVIYQGICANCSGGAFPTTPGAWAPANLSGNCNEAITKIAFDLAGVNSGVKSSIRSVDGDTSDCVPVTVNFRDTVAIAKSYEWNFGDGSPSIRTTVADITHTYTQVGIYRVTLVAVDSTKCFPRDTTYTTIRVREDYAPLNARAVKLPPCTSTNYQFTNLSSLSAPASGKPFKANSFRWIWGDGSPDLISGTQTVTHLYPGYGTYNAKLVLEDTNYCNAPDTFRLNVRIAPNVRASTSTPLAGCAPYNAFFNNTSLGGTDFFWDFGDGSTSTDISPTHLYPSPGVYRVQLIAVDTTTCNKVDTAYYNITVSGAPTAAFTYSPNPPTENTISVFTNQSVGAIRYRWYFGDGDSLYTFRLDTTVRHLYNETQRYVPCLVAINQYNCPDTACQNLDAIINPLLDVPNAFTPNNDGVNDRAVVIGYGISRMIFRIYNRWGQLVFETNDRKIGWDGNFNGKPQPMDVYAYTLEADYFDGKKTRKQGDITLLR